MGKNERRNKISEMIDLTGNRFKEAEYDELYDIVDHPDDYTDHPKSFASSHKGFSSEGKYTREERSTFRLRNVDGRIVGEEEYEYHDDDGQSGTTTYIFDSARDILSIARIIAGDDHGRIAESRKALNRSLSQKAKKRYEEQYADRQYDSYNKVGEKITESDNEAAIEFAKSLLFGIAKNIPKGIKLISEKGIPTARALGEILSKKNDD